MIDRALGVIGIALTFITAILQYYIPQLPTWAPAVGFGVGLFLLGLSVGLLMAGGLRRKRKVLPSALLRLHMYGDHRTPQRIADENIFRWFYLQTAIEGIGPEGRKRIGSFATLFISFQDDVIIHTLTLASPDIKLPVYEVKEFNQRYAIITFSDDMPAGTLEVRVST